MGLFQLLGWMIENEESVKGEDGSGKGMTDKGEGTHQYNCKRHREE